MHKTKTKNRISKVSLLCRLSLLFLLFFSSLSLSVLLFSQGSGLPFLTNKIWGSKCVLWQNKSASTLRVQCEGDREVYPWAGKPFGEAWSFKTWRQGAHITVHSSPLPPKQWGKFEFCCPNRRSTARCKYSALPSLYSLDIHAWVLILGPWKTLTMASRA